MLRHIFFWLSHCQKWRFPFCRANLDLSDIDTFPELIINLIARQFFDAVSGQPLMIYQPTEEAMLTPKGTINFNRYITNSISKGNFQNIECDYEPFLFDNKVNRIIKYCARLLMRQAKFSETQRILQEIIFILDEVEDIHCSSADIVNIKLNSFFDEYNLILESCKLILDQQIYSNNSSDLSQWCLLFPMEYIFEDFISGFISQHFSNKWTVKSQKSEMYLSDDPKAFKMRHDIFLTNGERKIIVDTKYKLRTFEKDDKKKGIAQSDMYQMVSYAFRRGCNDVLLLYPNIDEQISKPDLFEIGSGFVGKDKITVTAMNIPFWMEGALDCEKLTTKLRNRLEELLN
jgi:5-methylcytosine-specific restriction enzyme subunit McrC